MPPINRHLKVSMERTGKEYRDVHEWLDANPEKKVGRHDITKIHEYGRMFKERYGEEGAREYIQHIHDDLKAKFDHIQHDLEKSISDTLAYFGIK